MSAQGNRTRYNTKHSDDLIERRNEDGVIELIARSVVEGVWPKGTFTIRRRKAKFQESDQPAETEARHQQHLAKRRAKAKEHRVALKVTREAEMLEAWERLLDRLRS